MPEGLMLGGKIAGAVHDDPESQPPPGPDAPKGWTWNRGSRSWQPKVRGKDLWFPDDIVPSDAGSTPGGSDDYAKPDRDPAPGWMRDESKPAAGKQLAFDDVPQQVKDDIAGLGGLVATPILAMIQAVDPYCGGALAQSFEGIMDATLPLICRSERIVKYFSEDTADWLLWGKLAMALAPVGRAIVEHHITRTVTLVKDEMTGQVQVVRGRQPESDHLTPQAQPEYSPDSYAA